MFYKFVVSIILLFAFNQNEIYSTPINVLSQFQVPLQVLNDSNVLASQGLENEKNSNAPHNRQKRFLDVFMEFFDLIDDLLYGDEDDDSGEEDNSRTKPSNTQHDLCHNCSITYNEINHIHQVHHTEPPSNTNTQQSQNKIPTQEVATSTEKSTLQMPTKMGTLEAAEQAVSTTSTRQTIVTNPTKELATSPTTPQAITTAVNAAEE